MPKIFVFKLRSYLGWKRRFGPRDEASLDRFLAKCGTSRQALSHDQIEVLLPYCRKQRQMRLLLIPLGVVAIFAIYFIAIRFPQVVQGISSDFAPTHVIVIGSEAKARWLRENLPDEEAEKKKFGQIVMMFVIMGEAFGASSIFILIVAMDGFAANFHREALIDFLKASNHKPDSTPSNPGIPAPSVDEG